MQTVEIFYVFELRIASDFRYTDQTLTSDSSSAFPQENAASGQYNRQGGDYADNNRCPSPPFRACFWPG